MQPPSVRAGAEVQVHPAALAFHLVDLAFAVVPRRRPRRPAAPRREEHLDAAGMACAVLRST
jgi:hypothetical protein